jgi:hypothetical protein
MNLTKEKAWIIFRADKLQEMEGKLALNHLTKAEFDAYECHAEDFELELAKIGVEANNEAAAIMEAHPELSYLDTVKPYNWNAMDYRNIVLPFAGSKFEKLHLSAMFRVQNNELLLELVKP